MSDTDDSDVQPSPPSKRKRLSRPSKAVSEVGSNYSPSQGQHTPKPKAANALRRVRQSLTAEGVVSCSGIVKNIRMYNFMCHKGFEQAWHPNLNFVTGDNGSGKSALLTGLLIGLGAKATVTSRTRSIASLIQTGKDCARTEITLINNGALPVAKYGNELMIERTISKTGTSSYRLKAVGKIRKMKKHELDYILMSFNIQLDNPVAILNQEVAKNFLRTKDPKDKYKLFHQGTLLSKLFELLGDSRTSMDISEKNLEFQKNLLTQLRKEVRELEAKLKEVDNLSNVRRRNKELGVEFAWAVANDEEKRLIDLKKQLEGHDVVINKLVANLEASVEKKRLLQEEMQPGQDRTSEIRAKIQETEQSLEATRKEVTDAQKKIQICRATINTNKGMLKRKERMLNDVKQTLDKLKSSSQTDKDKAIQEYQQLKAMLMEEKAKVQDELNSLKRDCEQFYHGVETARAEKDAIMDEYKRRNSDYESKKSKLTNLQSAGSNKYAIFGRNMETLMSKININLRKFSKRPRGPVGANITVKDPKFAGLAEHVLKSNNFLTTFMVNNNEDFMLLKKLIQESYSSNSEYGRQSMPPKLPSIKVNKFGDKPYELNRGATRTRGLVTLFDVLEVEDNDCVILNGLVDYVDAERTLMFETNQIAAQTMKDSSRFPANTKHGFTLEWYRFYPAPNYAAQSLDMRSPHAQFLKSSKNAQINDLKTEMQQLKAVLDEMKPIAEQRRKHEADLRRQYDAMVLCKETKRRALCGVERRLADNEGKKYKEPDVASHEEEIKELENEVLKIREEDEESDQRIQEESRKMEALVNKKEDLQLCINKLQKRIDSGATERQQKVVKLQTFEQLIARCNLKIKDLKKTKEPTIETLRKCEKEHERKLKQAEEIGERVQSTRSANDVKREVEAIKIKISTMEKHIGDTEKLKREYKKKQDEFHSKLKDFTPIYKSFVMLKGVVASQITFLFRKRIEITNGLVIIFQDLVEQRGYKGKMIINHDQKELHFFICPDESSSKRTKNTISDNDGSTKKTLVEYTLGLSGGERSFSTICFIISLWQVMECPFYMLDEFDVFMDAFNRKASQQALICHAKSQKDHQFFLFSPLDLVEVPAKDEATVIRLKPARPDINDNNFSADNESENVDPSSQGEPTSGSGTSKSTKKSGPSQSKSKKVFASQGNRASRR